MARNSKRPLYPIWILRYLKHGVVINIIPSSILHWPIKSILHGISFFGNPEFRWLLLNLIRRAQRQPKAVIPLFRNVGWKCAQIFFILGLKKFIYVEVLIPSIIYTLTLFQFLVVGLLTCSVLEVAHQGRLTTLSLRFWSAGNLLSIQ